MFQVSRFKFSGNRGFTLIEMFVVFTVIMLLSAAAILYGRTSKGQMFLFQDQSRIISNLNRTKFLSLQAYQREYRIDCGYGMHFEEPDTFIIYKDRVESGSSCSAFGHRFEFNGDTDEKISQFKLNPVVKVGVKGFTDAVFVPPDPRLIIKNNGSFLDEAVFELKISGGDSNASAKIKINKYGQVSSGE